MEDFLYFPVPRFSLLANKKNEQNQKAQTRNASKCPTRYEVGHAIVIAIVVFLYS